MLTPPTGQDLPMIQTVWKSWKSVLQSEWLFRYVGEPRFMLQNSCGGPLPREGPESSRMMERPGDKERWRSQSSQMVEGPGDVQGSRSSRMVRNSDVGSLGESSRCSVQETCFTRFQGMVRRWMLWKICLVLFLFFVPGVLFSKEEG